MSKFRLIILDRDGVINQDSDSFIKTPEEWVAIPGSLEAIARLCREDYRVVIITNQSGISRGLLSINTLNRIHQKMLEELAHFGGEISAIFFCPHGDKERCDCRKPAPGLFLKLSDRLNCDLRDVYAVGDSLRDIQAAHAAAANPVLVRTGKGEHTLETIRSENLEEEFGAIPVYPDLAAFVARLLQTPH
ncbi:MAG: D-glycero-beta-D-manno-heptose 1,7-bisphosphate 7-phosphatase [Gammaproteobacteria bacterium]|nr:D-glycero-beta-D-manno-heptose 1,7-bisphosphate 7-phosphatase [Gammaproteobacteria bacterium]MYD76097.1 D-glycero-beta-D-manno-heptose 1,7-bisphosphate 7-phosphatase [Gammaproteobacteria bacterium]MYJ51264.1 D-glycero-beta-D-manno-heptose 1,7-bisphosphate 7-phosphatase [Gammaproteobacteria bacterium]